MDPKQTPIPAQLLQDDHATAGHPTSFADYCGQDALKKKLEIYTKAARARAEPLDHTLLFGPPGLGKTTLANIIAHTLGAHITICSGPTLERTGDLVALLTNLNPRDVLFIDEIHRMPTSVEEVLYNAMEHFRVDIIIGQGASAKSVNLPLSPFTLIGATTKGGMLSAPLRSRFGIIERLDFYEVRDLQKILEHAAQQLGCPLLPEAAQTVAHASRGTPRIAKNILRRVRDIAQSEGYNHITRDMAQQALTFLGIDHDGLCALDHAILRTIAITFEGGPVGLETVASMIGEDSETIEEVYEPYLMRQGLLERTPRGRKIPATAQNRIRNQMSLV